MADDDRTRLWQRTPARGELRAYVATVIAAPLDPEARRQLRAAAAEHGVWDELATLLAAAVRTADDPNVIGVLLEELADAHENLDRPLETIATMERLIEHEPGELAYHDRLARLYHRAGAWIKAAEAFERVAQLARDDKERAALRAAARLYGDHGRPERAAATYHALLSRFPADLDAWRALDQLLGELGRWNELAEVRGTLAARATDGVERAALLRAHARALEQAGDAPAAAALVAQASQLVPEDVSGLVDYTEVLARGGRGQEAAELLATRIAAAAADGAPIDEVAALQLRRARILDESCADRAAAIEVLEALLAAAPRYLPGLERLGWLTSQAGDPRAHASALRRHAAALDAGPARAGVLVQAARALRDAGDRGAAARAFEEACELVPDDAGLARERDDARAAVLVDRAREEARAGDLASAEQRLIGVIASRPHDLDANLALAELLVGAGRLPAAAEHLRATLAAAPADTPGERLAQIVHRYAGVAATLGDVDQAHQLLHEAHRLDRRSLPITLALGNSSFARRLWREAALHLGSLADHPDATTHAAAVATALVHAAQAETRGLRPANAEKHHAAAVRIDPSCAPAWHALAEIATERGDVEGAAEYLEREAVATTDPRDRVRLFDALGDLALGVLADPERAERCWLQVAGDDRSPVLGKLLAVQRRRGAGTPRGETCVRLAAREPDLRARKQLIEEAAEAFVSGGALVRARASAEELIAAHPLDVDAVACATAVTQAAGDHARTIAWLARALAAWDATDPADGDPRRAELWRRLADARVGSGDLANAGADYERAIAVAPESDGALAARRGLVELATATGSAVPGALAALVEAEHRPADVLAWARECAQTATTIATAHALFGLARALGEPLAERDVRFLTDHPPRIMASDQAYAAVVPEPERRAIVDDDADAPLAGVLEALGEIAPLVCPTPSDALARRGFAGAGRLSATSHVAAAALYPQIANALGGPTALLHATTGRDDPDLTVLLAAPPVIVLGPRLASIRARSAAEPDPHTDAELRFRLGRAIELVRPRRVFAAAAGPVGLARLIGALIHALVRPETEPADGELAAESLRLRSTIPLLLRRRLGEQLAALGADAIDPARFHAACERAADRSGLLACGDVDTAIRLAGGPSVARHLVHLAASPRYHAVHRTSWFPDRR